MGEMKNFCPKWKTTERYAQNFITYSLEWKMTANSENKSPEMGNIFRLFYFYFYLLFLVCAKFLRLYLCAQPSYTCVCVCCGLESFMFLTDGGKILYIHLDTQMVWLRRFAFSNAKQNQRRNNRRIPLNDTPS